MYQNMKEEILKNVVKPNRDCIGFVWLYNSQQVPSIRNFPQNIILVSKWQNA